MEQKQQVSKLCFGDLINVHILFRSSILQRDNILDIFSKLYSNKQFGINVFLRITIFWQLHESK